jgi:hypothetical protein
MKCFLSVGVIALFGLIVESNPACGQGTEFTYQGRLADNGQPANGLYDLTFKLFNASTSGSQVDVTITYSAVTVSNGLFSAVLDFSGNFPGADRWLEIGVRPNGGGAFTTLSPRQKLTSTPYAITAANLTGGLPAVQLSGTILATQMGSLTNHSDVVVTSLAPGDGLAFNGAVWTNGPASSAGGGGGGGVPISLSYSGTNVAVNASLGSHFRLLATNSFLLQNPTGATDSQRLIFEIIQDNVGSRTLTLGNAFRLGTDIFMVNLSTNANRRDFVTCVCSGTNFFVVGFVRGY